MLVLHQVLAPRARRAALGQRAGALYAAHRGTGHVRLYSLVLITGFFSAIGAPPLERGRWQCTDWKGRGKRTSGCIQGSRYAARCRSGYLPARDPRAARALVGMLAPFALWQRLARDRLERRAQLGKRRAQRHDRRRSVHIPGVRRVRPQRASYATKRADGGE